MDNAEKDILSVSEGRNKAGFIPISTVLRTAYESLEERAKNNGEVTGDCNRVYRLRQNDVRATCG